MRNEGQIETDVIDIIEDCISSNVDYILVYDTIEICGIEKAAKDIFDFAFKDYIVKEIETIKIRNNKYLKDLKNFYVNWPGYY